MGSSALQILHSHQFIYLEIQVDCDRLLLQGR
jgi:hypothetical protein